MFKSVFSAKLIKRKFTFKRLQDITKTFSLLNLSKPYSIYSTDYSKISLTLKKNAFFRRGGGGEKQRFLLIIKVMLVILKIKLYNSFLFLHKS